MKSITFLLLWSFFVISYAEKITFGWAFPSDSSFEPMMRTLFNLAVDKINSNPSIIHGYQVEVVSVPLKNSFSDEEKLENYSKAIFENESMAAMLGFLGNLHVESASLIGSAVDMPIIAGGSTLTSMTDKSEHPMYTSLFHAVCFHALAAAGIAHDAGFKRVAHFGFPNLMTDGSIELVQEFYEQVGIQYIGTKSHSKTNNVDILFPEVDIALDELNAEGTRVIMYAGISAYSKVVAWRAWKKGMMGIQPSGEVYQWVFTLDAAGDYIFNDDYPCMVEECANDFPEVRKALIGSFVTPAGIIGNEDWFNNEWVPNVTVDKLSASDIAISGASDWAAAYRVRFGVMYDMPFVIVEAIKNMCEAHTEMEFDACIGNLPNMGGELMTYIGTAEVEEGATGHVKFNDNRDRIIPIKIGQWMGEGIEFVGTWDVESKVNYYSPPLYATQTGIPSDSINLTSSHTSIAYILSIFIAIVMTMFVFVMMRKKKVLNLKLKSFFTKNLSILITVSVSFSTILNCLCAAHTISTTEPWTTITIFNAFLWCFPFIAIFSIIGFRLYRYYCVTHNRQLRQISFGRFAQSKVMATAMVIMIPGLVFWCLKCVDLVDGEGISKLFLIQDDVNHSKMFTLTAPTYALLLNNELTLLVVSAFVSVYLGIVVGGCALLARMCGSSSDSHGVKVGTNANVMRQMNIMVQSFVAIVFVLGLSTLALSLMHGNPESDEAKEYLHIGFDNVGSKANMKFVNTFIVIKMLVSCSIWVSCMYMVFSCSLKKGFIAALLGRTALLSTTTANSVSYSVNTTAVEKHDLSSNLKNRLKVGAFNTFETRHDSMGSASGGASGAFVTGTRKSSKATSKCERGTFFFHQVPTITRLLRAGMEQLMEWFLLEQLFFLPLKSHLLIT